MNQTKTCRSCKELRSVSDFYKKKSGLYGVTGSCRTCIISVNTKAHADNRALRIEQMRSYRKNNIAYLRAYDRDRYKRDSEKRLNYVRAWRENNPDKVKSLLKSWADNNRGHKYAIGAERRASKLNATPKWLTDSHRDEIKSIYRDCPKGHHVDHIIPLKGKDVCGLHVPWNLQYLLAVENLRKGKKVA